MKKLDAVTQLPPFCFPLILWALGFGAMCGVLEFNMRQFGFLPKKVVR